MFDPKEVTNLLDETRNASNSLLALVKAKAGIGLDVKIGLSAIKTPVVKLLDIQAKHRVELTQLIPNLPLSLADAYHAVAETGSEIDPKKRPDLYELAEEVNSLLRSLNEPPM
jgi:hypothetical protein